MILFLCLWQLNIMQSVIAFLSWTILHVFFTISLTHLTLNGHQGPCCNTRNKNGTLVPSPCKQRLVQSVRSLLELTYAVIIPVWSLYLLLTGRNDIESHAFLYITALGYNVYSIFWAMKDFGLLQSKKFPFFTKQPVSSFMGKNKLLHLVQCILATCITGASVSVLSNEMANWRNSAVPLMMDVRSVPSGLNHPTNVQKKALSHHLLAKPSEVAWLLTLNLLVHETPNIFFNTIKLLRITSYKASQIKSRDFHHPNAETAVAAGVAAWRRERGMIKPPYMQHYILEDVLSKLHRLVFLCFRVLGGFMTLNQILKSEMLVRDTLYVASALLYHGIAIYLFGGIVAYTAKRNKNRKLNLRKSISWQLATAVSDDWLNYN